MAIKRTTAIGVAILVLVLLLAGSGWVIYVLVGNRPTGTNEQANANPLPTPPPAPPPARIKVGVIISLRTATEPGWIGKGYGYNAQTHVIPDLTAPDIDLYPVIEAGSADADKMPQTLRQLFPRHAPIDGTDPVALRQLDVLVANQVWETTPELLKAVASVVEHDGLGLLNNGGIGAVKPELHVDDTTPARLAGLLEGEYAYNHDKAACEIIRTHPLLGNLTTLPNQPIMLEPNGVFGILPPGATPLIKLVNPSDVQPVGTNAFVNDRYTFYLLYTSSLGKGKIIGCEFAPWKPVPIALQNAAPGRFFARCVRWLQAQRSAPTTQEAASGL